MSLKWTLYKGKLVEWVTTIRIYAGGVKATQTSGQNFMLVMKAAEKQEVQFSTLPIQTR
jgi:hypothetical protein